MCNKCSKSKFRLPRLYDGPSGGSTHTDVFRYPRYVCVRAQDPSQATANNDQAQADPTQADVKTTAPAAEVLPPIAIIANSTSKAKSKTITASIKTAGKASTKTLPKAATVSEQPTAPPAVDQSIKKAVYAPALKVGATYLYPKRHTYLHVIRNIKVWAGNCGAGWTFKMARVGTCVPVFELIEIMLGKEGDACKGWKVTEVIEAGDGKWSKVCLDYDQNNVIERY